MNARNARTCTNARTCNPCKGCLFMHEMHEGSLDPVLSCRHPAPAWPDLGCGEESRARGEQTRKKIRLRDHRRKISLADALGTRAARLSFRRSHRFSNPLAFQAAHRINRLPARFAIDLHRGLSLISRDTGHFWIRRAAPITQEMDR